MELVPAWRDKDGLPVFDFWQEDFIRLSDHDRIVQGLRNEISMLNYALGQIDD